MYANIRQQTRPQEFSGLQSVNVPSETTTNGESNFSYLQKPPQDVIWEKVIDRAAIETHILTYNRESFRAAAASPCGHGIIHDEHTLTGLSSAAKGLLQGLLPDHWQATDAHLQAFLASFTLPKTEKNTPPISTSISTKDVSRGFKLWKEKTTTSPSGRHIGHYKALALDPSLLSSLAKFLHITVNKDILSKYGAKLSTS